MLIAERLTDGRPWLLPPRDQRRSLLRRGTHGGLCAAAIRGPLSLSAGAPGARARRLLNGSAAGSTRAGDGSKRPQIRHPKLLCCGSRRPQGFQANPRSLSFGSTELFGSHGIGLSDLLIAENGGNMLSLALAVGEGPYAAARDVVPVRPRQIVQTLQRQKGGEPIPIERLGIGALGGFSRG